MTLFEAAVLGVVQGLTEFLPVSSSGHLVVVQKLLGVDAMTLIFGIVLHLGTAVAVTAFMWRDVVEILSGLMRLLMSIGGRGGLMSTLRTDEGARLAALVFVASIPTGVAGLLLGDAVESMFSSLVVVGLALAVTGLLLTMADRLSRGKKSVLEATWLDAIVMGVAQGMAVTPGLSRSGCTVSTGLIRGLSRETAARISFLMSIPVIVGAALLELKDFTTDPGAAVGVSNLLVGALAAFMSGYLAVRLFLDYVKRGRLKGFAIYCFVMSFLVIVSQVAQFLIS